MTNDDKYLIDKLVKTRIDWNGPVQAAIVVAIILGGTIPFYLMHRSEIRAIEENNRSWQERVLRLEEQRLLAKQPTSASSPAAS